MFNIINILNLLLCIFFDGYIKINDKFVFDIV